MQIDPNNYSELQNQPPQIVVPQLIAQQQPKKTYLERFYSAAIFQFSVVLIISQILQINILANLFVEKHQSSWWGDNYTFQEYLTFYSKGYGQTYEDFYNWKQSYQRDYYHYEFRWTYFFILGLFTTLTIGLPIFKKYRCFVQHQERVYYTQTILIGLVLGGFIAVSKHSWKYSRKLAITRFTCIILILNAILNIALARRKKLQRFGRICKIVAYSTLPINLIYSFTDYMGLEVAVAELILIYCLHYFNQLNYSMVNKDNLPEEFNFAKKIKEVISTIQENNELKKAKEILQQNNFVIRKKFIYYFASMIGGVGIWLSCLAISTEFFVVVTIIAVIQPIFLLLDTQVVGKNLQDEDVFIGVSSVYLDLVCPIKNIIRNLQI